MACLYISYVGCCLHGFLKVRRSSILQSAPHMVHPCMLMKRLIDALTIRSYLIFLLCAQNVLSVLLVFSSPIPLPPRTSVGVLTGMSLLLIISLYVSWKQKKIHTIPIEISDWFVLGFVAANAVSLLGSSYIYEFTGFRLLLNAVVQYIAVRLLPLSQKEKQMLLFTIGIATVAVAFMSLFQVVFRDQAILLVKRFLFGDAAFSLSWDLARGRGPQWGTIIVSFPFFILSVLFWKQRTNRLFHIYMKSGIFLIPFSFIVSNFRWLTLCFVIGVGVFVYPFIKQKLISMVKLRKIILVTLAAIISAILFASVVFQYNLIDRFLLKEKQRDIVFTFGRTFLYQQAITTFLSSPIIGIGTGNYRYIVERPIIVHYYDMTDISGENGVDETQRETVSSHNDALTILAETGLFGLIMFVGLNIVVLARLFFIFRKARQTNNAILIAYPTAFITALFMYYGIGVFENTTPNIIIFIFFLYAASMTWFPVGGKIKT